MVLKINAKLERLNSMLSIERVLCDDHRNPDSFDIPRSSASLNFGTFDLSSFEFFYSGPIVSSQMFFHVKMSFNFKFVSR